MSRTSYPRLVLLGAALAVGLASTSGCHRGGGEDGGASLAGALATVGDTDASRAYLEWAYVSRIRELGGVTQQHPAGSDDVDHRRWASQFGVGAGNLGNASVQLAGTIDLFNARSAVLIGMPPRTAVRIDGVDTGRARAGLLHYGGRTGKVAGHDGVILAGDNEIKLDSPLAELGILNAFNKVAFDGNRVAFGASEEPVGTVLTGGAHPLIGNPSVAVTANCLGDVLTATIAPAASATVGGGAQTIGIGVRNPARGTDAAVEVLCLAAPDKGTADRLEQQVRQHATLSAQSQASRQPWSNLVSAITVSRDGDRTVRVELTDQASRPAGLLYRALQQRDITSLTG